MERKLYSELDIHCKASKFFIFLLQTAHGLGNIDSFIDISKANVGHLYNLLYNLCNLD